MRAAGSAARVAIIVGALVGCRDQTTAPSRIYSASPPARDLSDAANGGRAGFYFLPPLVKQPTYSGTSDPSQSPTVVVCELVASPLPHCGTIEAAFSLASGTGSQVIRYDSSAQQYVVNWQTDQCLTGSCALDPSKTYRIRVLIGAVELGHADVVLVNNASEIKNAQTGEVTALVNGRTLPIKFRIETGAVNVPAIGGATTIGSGGGAIATNDGQVALEFSSGALSTSTQITVALATDAAPGGGAWSPPISLGPDGTTFAGPVTLAMHFDAAKLPPGVPLSALRMYTQVGSGWVEVPGSTVNESDNSVSAPIQHFSYYEIGISPNTIQGQIAPATLVVGQSGTLTGWAVSYQTVPQTYCYWYSYWVGTGLGRGYYDYYQVCYAGTATYEYPIQNQLILWHSSNPSALAFLQGLASYTGTHGETTSPPLTALHPGSSRISATSGSASEVSVTYTSLGKLGLIPRNADLVAGWSHLLQLTQSVAIPTPVTVSLTSKNTMLVAEPGTANYTYGGQTGPYVIAANATTKQLTMAELNGPTTDTLIAFTAGYVPDTAIIHFVKGNIGVAGWPASLSVGDSVPLTITVLDQSGNPSGNLAYPVSFALTPTTGLAFSDGHQAITSVIVQQRTSSTFYVKATVAGQQQVSITSRDYVTYANTMNVAPAAPAAPVAYVANFSSNTVIAINTATSTPVGPAIPVGVNPLGVAITPDNSQVYVANLGSNSVSVINRATNTVTATIPIGGAASAVAIAPDGTRAYVSDYSDGTVVAINTTTNTVVGSPIAVGPHPTGVAVRPDGARIYASNEAGNNLSVINAATNTVVATIPTGTAPEHIVFTPDGLRAYVTNATSNNLTVINTTTNAVVTTVPLAIYPLGLAMTPDGRHVYIANALSNVVAILDVATNTTAPSSIFVPSTPEAVAITPDGTRAFVAVAGTDYVATVNTATNAVIGAPIPAGSRPRAIAITGTAQPQIAPIPDAVPSYVIVVLPGLSPTASGEADGINLSGRIIGLSSDAGVYWDASTAAPTIIPNPYFDLTHPTDVNAAGEISVSTGYKGYVYQPATGTTTLTPLPPENLVVKYHLPALNNTQLALGCVDFGAGAQNFVWDRNAGTTTLIPGAFNYCNGRINDAGQAVVNFPGAGPMVWNQSSKTEVTLPSLGGEGAGLDINASGVVVGLSRAGSPSGPYHAFRWLPGAASLDDIGTLGGDQSQASAVNRDGVIVGWSVTASGLQRAFVWLPATRQMIDLGALSPGDGSVATDINDAGVIVGYNKAGDSNSPSAWKPVVWTMTSSGASSIKRPRRP